MGLAGCRVGKEPLNKLLNSHPVGFYFYLNGVAEIRIGYGFLPDLWLRIYLYRLLDSLYLYRYLFSRFHLRSFSSLFHLS